MLYALSLGGDGDEIDAIQAVEKRLAVTFDDHDAPTWVTVGDLFQSLLRVAPASADERTAWTHFVVALCSESGDEPHQVTPETRLIDDRSILGQLRDALGRKRKAG